MASIKIMMNTILNKLIKLPGKGLLAIKIDVKNLMPHKPKIFLQIRIKMTLDKNQMLFN